MANIPEYITNCGGIPSIPLPEECPEYLADCGGIPPEPLITEDQVSPS